MVRVRDVVVVGGGLLGLGLVAVLFVEPSLLFRGIPALADRVSVLDPSIALVIAGALLVAVLGLKLLLNVVRRGFGSTAGGMETPESRASSQSLFGGGESFEALGATVDRQFRTATDYRDADETRRQDARDDVVARLREAATTAYAQSTGRPPEHAADAVATGEWTDDRRAAGLLSDDEGPSIPVHLYLLDLLLGRDPFVAGVERSLSAIAAVNDDTLASTDRGSGWIQGAVGR